MSPLTLGVDVDEVCANLLGEWLRRYNLRYNDTKRPEDIRGWSMTENVKPECGEAIYDILHEPDLYDAVRPIPGALDAVQELRADGHRVVFVSSCVVGSVDAKVRWLIRHRFLPMQSQQKDFIACSDKVLIGADFLFDDNVETCERFHDQAYRGFGVVVTVPHNSEQATHCPRIAGLIEAPRFIRDHTNSDI